MAGLEEHFELTLCLSYSSKSSMITRQKSPTAGVRILSIDGGGIGGVIPLEVLKILQNLIGRTLLQDLFDEAFGTSSSMSRARMLSMLTGIEGLSVTGLFIAGWSVDECIA